MKKSATTISAPPTPTSRSARTRNGNGSSLNGNQLDQKLLLAALMSFKRGDFSARLPVDWTGMAGKIAETFNEVISSNERMTAELERIGRVVGKEGRITQRASLGDVGNSWAAAIGSVNGLIGDLVQPTSEMARVIGAVAKGDLSKTMETEIEGRALEGEFLRTAKTVNTMVDQLGAFASEVTRVAREVGTEGKLGGQAKVKGVAGTWKDLTENVNLMAGNITAQVRNIATVTTAVANGDLTKKITVDVKGEFLELKDNAGLYKAAQKARTEAESANRAKDQFLAMLSHELRTPLTPVLSSVFSLEHEEDLPESIRESLQMIRRNVELEARLIDDLLDLTRISKGKVQLSLEVVDAHTLLRNALDICQGEIKQKNLALELDLAATHVCLKADPARLQQIFWNLIKNAVKFTPAGGCLRVRTGDEHDQFRVEVSDTGIGIERELLPKIFDAFEQGEGAHLGGLGLGLAITKALVETHQGQIRAESAGRNRGATFTVTLPVSQEVTDQAQPSQRPVSVERQSRKILLVEDHVDTNHSLTNLLRRRGYHVEPALTMRDALDLAGQEQFDVLVSDIGLPDGSGLELIKTLQVTRPLFGIALTGYGMEEDVQKSYDSGFTYHLVKPVDLNKLDLLIQQGAEKGKPNGEALAAP